MAKPLKQTALLLLRIVVGGIFLYAAVVKIWDFKAMDWATQQFARDVQNFQLTSWTTSILTAVYLPWLELLAGAALIAGKLQAGALALLGGLTAFFLVAIASAWARGLDISCGCFGKAQNATNFPLHLAADAALLAAIAILAAGEWRRGKSPQNAPPAVL